MYNNSPPGPARVPLCQRCVSGIRNINTHCYWRAEVRVHQRTLKHGFLFVEDIHIPPLEKLWLKKISRAHRYTVKPDSLYQTRTTSWYDLKHGVQKFDVVPVVLVSVSWAGCPPPLSCVSSPLGSVLCSCSGSSCSYLWPDWQTALMGHRQSRWTNQKTAGIKVVQHLLYQSRTWCAQDICLCFPLTSLIIGHDDEISWI